MFATPPGSPTVIAVSNAPCERRHAATAERGQVVQWPLHQGISGPETLFTYSVGRKNCNYNDPDINTKILPRGPFEKVRIMVEHSVHHDE